MAVTNGYDKDRRLNIAAAPAQEQNTPNIRKPNIASGQGIGTAATHINDKTNDGKQYTPGQDVTDAKKRMEETEQKKPGEYKPSDAVTAAEQALANIDNTKPKGYDSKYGSALDGILDKIQNQQEFKYSFDGDELFKYYADLYTQKGKQASADAMGQAAALTGGYGNSYAQQVGNQAYDQYLLSLYDKGMDLRDRAYQQYQDQRADIYNQFNALGDADARDYDRYRDTVSDWEKDRDYLTGRYDTERTFDYGKYRDTVSDWEKDRDYYSNRYDTERTFDYGQFTDQRNFDENQRQFNEQMQENARQFNEQMQENVRQFNESLNWDKMDSNQKQAASWVAEILANGQMPSAELLMAAGLSEEDAQKMMAKLTTGSNGNPKKTKPKTYYTDPDGNYYEFDDKGNAKLVDKSVVKEGDIVDPSIGNFMYNAGNAAKDIAATVKEQWNGSDLKNDVDTLVNTGKDLFSGFSSLFGKKKDKD